MDKEVVRYIADLARINIDSEEEKFLGEQLKKILNYIDKLKELDVEGIEPTWGVHVQDNIFRDDTVRDSRLQEKILSNAVAREGNYFKIPKVI